MSSSCRWDAGAADTWGACDTYKQDILSSYLELLAQTDCSCTVSNELHGTCFCVWARAGAADTWGLATPTSRTFSPHILSCWLMLTAAAQHLMPHILSCWLMLTAAAQHLISFMGLVVCVWARAVK